MIASDGKPTISNRIPLDLPDAEPPSVKNPPPGCTPGDVLAVIFKKREALERIG